MMRGKLFFPLLLCVVPLATAQVRVWQGTLKLPTYEERLPDHRIGGLVCDVGHATIGKVEELSAVAYAGGRISGDVTPDSIGNQGRCRLR